jgi:hypothetical protein
MRSLLYGTCGLAFLGAAAFLSPSSSSAAGLPLPSLPGTVGSEAVQVQHGRCFYWYRVCRIRWGYGWRFRRCMAIHACLP